MALDDAGSASASWVAANQFVSAVRAGLNPFTAPRPLSGATTAGDHTIGASANGEALAVFVGESNGNDAVFAARRTAGAEFGGVTTLLDTPPGGPTVFINGPDIALDDQGNGFAVWQRRVFPGTTGTAQFAGFDPVPPVITAADVPASADRRPGRHHVGRGDRPHVGGHAAVRLRRRLGAVGPSVQHAYAAPGAYTVTVTAGDAGGNRSTFTRTIQVAPVPVIVASGGPTTTAPVTRRVLAVAAMSWDRLRTAEPD